MRKSYFSVIFLGYLIFLTIYSVIPTASMSEKYGIGGFELRLDYWLHMGAYFGVAFLFLLWQFNSLVDKRDFFYWANLVRLRTIRLCH
jgi:hypothetical protein